VAGLLDADIREFSHDVVSSIVMNQKPAL